MKSSKVISGAEAFFYKKGTVGCLLSHGFTGTPKEVRNIGEFLAQKGLTVIGPRLPGHGTTIEDMISTNAKEWFLEYKEAYEQLSKYCDEIFIGGLSLGGVLTLKFAIEKSIQGIIVMAAPYKICFPQNVLLTLFAPFLKNRSIKKSENSLAIIDKLNILCYPRDPIGPANSIRKFIKTYMKDLHKITAPILFLQGLLDDQWVIDSTKKLYEQVGSKNKEIIFLPNSPHCLTMGPDSNNVKELIYTFIKKHSQILP